MAALGRSVLRVAATVVVTVVSLLVLVVAWLTQTASGRAVLIDAVVAEANDSLLRGTLAVDRVSGPVFGALALHGVRIDDGAGVPVLSADRIEARYDLVALLSRRVEVAALSVHGIDVALVASDDGSLNVATLLLPGNREDDDSRVPGAAWTVNLGHVSLSHAVVTYRDSDSEAPRLTAAVERAEGRFGLDDAGRISAGLASLDGAWRYDGVGADVALREVTFVRDNGRMGASAASVETFGVRVSGLSATVPNALDGNDVEASIDAIDMDPGPLHTLLGQPVVRGPLRARLDVSGPASALSVSMPVTGPDGTVTLDATLDLTLGDGPGIDALVRWSRLVPASWAHVDMDADVAGSLRVRGHGFDAAAAEWTASLDLGPSQVDRFGVHGLWAEASFAANRVALAGLHVWRDGAEVHARGAADLTSGRVEADVAVDVFDAELALAAAGVDGVAARGSARATVSAEGVLPLADWFGGAVPEGIEAWLNAFATVDARVVFSGRAIEFDGARVDTVTASLTAEPAVGRPRLTLELDAAGVAAAGETLQRVGVEAGGYPDALWLRGDVVARGGAARASLTASGGLSGQTVRARVESLSATWEAWRANLEGPVEVVAELDTANALERVEVAGLMASVGPARVAGAGHFDPPSGRVGADVTVGVSDVGAALGLAALTLPVAGGALETRVVLGGRLAAPEVRVTGAVDDLAYAQMTGMSATWDARYARGGVALDAAWNGSDGAHVTITAGDAGLPVSLDLARGVAALRDDAPVSVRLVAEQISAATVRSLDAELLPLQLDGGVLGGELEVSGTMRALVAETAWRLDDVFVQLDGDQEAGAAGDGPWSAGLTATLVADGTASATVSVARAGRPLGTAEGSVRLGPVGLGSDLAAALDGAAFRVTGRAAAALPTDLPPALAETWGVTAGNVETSLAWTGSLRGGDGFASVGATGIVIDGRAPVTAYANVKAGSNVQVTARFEAPSAEGAWGDAAPRPLLASASLLVSAPMATLLAEGIGDVALLGRVEVPATPFAAAATLSPTFGERSGTVGGYVDVTGTIGAPTLLGRLAFRGFDAVATDVEGAVGVEVRFADGMLDATVIGCDGAADALDARVRLEVPWDDVVAGGDLNPGSWPIEGHLSATRARLAAIVPTVMMEDIATGVAGTLDAQLSVAGTVGAPAIVGDASLREGAIGLTALGRTWSDVAFDAHFTPTEYRFADVRITDDRGSIRGTAVVLHDATAPRELEARLRVEDLLIAQQSGGTFVISGGIDLDATLEDREGRSSIDAEVMLRDLVVVVPDDQAAGAGPTARPDWVYVVGEDVEASEVGRRAPRRIEVIAEGGEASADTDGLGPALVARIRTDGQGSVRQQYANVQFDADLVASLDEALTMSGRVDVPRGQVRAAGNLFEIRRGAIVFAEGDADLDPSVDILAVHTLPAPVGSYLAQRVGPAAGDAATVQVAVRGQLSELLASPETALRLTSDPAMGEADIFQVLASGKLASDDLGADEQQGVAVLSALLLGVVGDRLTGGIPIDTLRIESAGGSQRVEGGKYIADNLYLSGAYIRSPDDRTDNNFEVSLDWILRQIGPGSLRMEVRGGDRAKGSLELMYNVIRAAREQSAPPAMTPVE